MNRIIEKMNNLPKFRCFGGAAADEINAAEISLGVKFAKEYRDYLEKFGTASFSSHELTGLCNSKRLNVTDVTNEEREYNPKVPENLYVIEQTNIDGIVIWQSASGEIYQSMPGEKIIKIADSLSEYVENIDNQ